MKRILWIGLTVALLVLFCLPVMAATEATTMGFQAAVAGDGSAQVTVTVDLRLESAQEELSFPVPLAARNVTLNGARVQTRQRGTAQYIDLSRTMGNMAGSYTFTVNYILDDVVSKNDAGLPMMELPMMSGFRYSVSYLEFFVSMPDQVDAKPAFSSGYHHSSIEEDLRASVSGNLITGKSVKSLKDQETLVMTLDVPETMFPDQPVYHDSAITEVLVVAGILLLALLYWLLFWRTGPLRSRETAIPPDGFTAGELGSLLCLEGADLTMMVFSWAQLGYILIQPERGGRVLLHKRMEMGNERSEFEQRIFRALFSRRRTVDATSARYANLSLKARSLSSGVCAMLQPSAGNPRIFRILGACAAAVCGFYMGYDMVSGMAVQILLGIVLGSAAFLAGLSIQRFAPTLFLHRKRALYRALVWCGIWLCLGVLAGHLLTAAVLTVSQLLVGLMASYGGKRTPEGRRVAGNILGLRKYLKQLSYPELQRMVRTDPELFHKLAPYALALGVDKRFASRFGSDGIPGCPYLTTGMDGHRSAREWAALMRNTVSLMDRRERQQKAERISKALQSLRK